MNEAIAHDVLSELAKLNPQTRTTTQLLQRIGIPKTQRWSVLKILHAAHACKYVSKIGAGNFKWGFSGERLYNGHSTDLSDIARIVDGGKEVEPIKTRTCKCGGTGVWINPNNLNDRRPCFYCRPDEANKDRESRNGGKDSQEGGKEAIVDSALKSEVQELQRSVSSILTVLGNLKNGVSREIKITKPDGKVKVLKDAVLPEVFDEVLDLAMMRKNILLVGPAGCGKTKIGELVAEALDLPFSAINCSEEMSASRVEGKDVPNLKTGTSNYVYSQFSKCYVEGGVFVLDEIDASNSNVLLCMNSALANGYLPTSTERLMRHKDFVCIATANTMGKGATRQYVGRNQLDASTLDRFKIGTVEVDYDERVEKALCPDAEIFNMVRGVRVAAAQAGLRQVISTRFMQDAYEMKVGRGWSLKKIIDKLLTGWSDDEKAKVRFVFTQDFSNAGAR